MLCLGGLVLRIGRTRSLFTRCRKDDTGLGGAVIGGRDTVILRTCTPEGVWLSQ
jgi:hypothetical protein